MLKEHIDVMEFLDKVSLCRGEVTLVSGEGDVLNLKSELSRFALVACVDKKIVREGKICCQDPSDYSLLSAYITAWE